MKKQHLVLLVLVLILVLLSLIGLKNRSLLSKKNLKQIETEVSDEGRVPNDQSVTSQDINNAPQDTSALGGYNVLIADRGNNRIIEVTPDKKIVWQYHFDLPARGLGADDAFFTDEGKSVIVNLEEYHVIEIIDYATKQVTWSYGTAGKPGSADGQLNTPDDAYRLSNGNVVVADIKNCRVIEINKDKKIVHQYGRTKDCGNKDGLLNKPNGDTPLSNGHILISNIVGKNLIELDQNWQKVFTMPLPVKYPSDPQLTRAGNILIADYSKPGQIVETSKEGKIIWQFSGESNDVKLSQPSLAIELPNGNILSNDDFNSRVIVIDKKTKKIIWQYGVTGKPGVSIGQLSIPDGVDIIKHTADNPVTNEPALNPIYIGAMTRHAGNFIGKTVTVTGYLREQYGSYAIFSDEITGGIGIYDLPVSGMNVGTLKIGQKYILQGIFLDSGLVAHNQSTNHLELTLPAQPN